MERVEYAGWKCLRVVSGDVEALVTLSVGPRVIRLGFVGSENLFYEKPLHRGLVGGSEYRGYGGHRLWLAPEDPNGTYWPDNDPVEEIDGWCFNAPDGQGVRRGIKVTSLGGGRFEVAHRAVNAGSQTPTVALWALSVVAPGGSCLVPQPEFRSHGEAALLPNRKLVLWPYTRLDDPRFSFGSDSLTVRQSTEGTPTKLGGWVEEGWVAYQTPDVTFIKTFPALPGEYPDEGCNFEVFTRHDMLEVESLGPLHSLQPGESMGHIERWRLLPGSLSLTELRSAAQELARG